MEVDMAVTINGGRWTDGHEGGVVVFLIGMRINRWRAVRSWWPVLNAMPAMLRELSADRSRGLLGFRGAIGPGGPVLVQYWRSVEDLLTYAHDSSAAHRPAWRAYNARARSAGDAVGIWHETYVVPPGAHETVYGSMPTTGLAAATSVRPVQERTATARERLVRQDVT